MAVLIQEYIISCLVVNTEPVHSGQEGADEPPTLIKEDPLSAGAVRRSAPDTQVYFNYLNDFKRDHKHFPCSKQFIFLVVVA